MAGVADPLERMRLGGKAYTEFALTQPHYYRLMFQLERNEMMEKYMPQCTNAYEAFGFVIHAVQEAMDMGVFKQDLPAVVVAASIWAGLHGAISLSLTGHLHIMMPPENDMMLYEHVAEGLLRQNLLKTT